MTFDILHIIFLSGVGEGNMGSMGIILFQLGLSLWSTASYCYSLIKESKLVGLMAILLPSGFAFVYIIIISSGFDYFLFNKQEPHIINIVMQDMQTTEFMYEMMILSAIFLITLFIYCYIKKPKWFEFILSYSVEIVTVLAFVILYGGLFIDSFPYNVVNVSENNFLIIKWFLYGISLLILKTAASIVAISLNFLLKERKKVRDETEQYHSDFYEKETLQFLKKDMKQMAIILYVFYIVIVAVFIWLFDMNERATDVGIILFIVSLPFLLIALYFTYEVKNMVKSKVFQTLKMQNDINIFKKFHDEIILKTYHSRMIGLKEHLLTSETFTIHKAGALLKNITIKETENEESISFI